MTEITKAQLLRAADAFIEYFIRLLPINQQSTPALKSLVQIMADLVAYERGCSFCKSEDLVHSALQYYRILENEYPIVMEQVANFSELVALAWQPLLDEAIRNEAAKVSLSVYRVSTGGVVHPRIFEVSRELQKRKHCVEKHIDQKTLKLKKIKNELASTYAQIDSFSLSFNSL